MPCRCARTAHATPSSSPCGPAPPQRRSRRPGDPKEAAMKKTCEAAVRAVGGAAVIELTGEVDGGAAGVLNAAYEQAVAEGEPGTVVLDFARVDYINSTGIALIVSVLARARSERRKVVASGLSEHYREIFDITRLSDFIEVFGDLDAAVSQMAGPAHRSRRGHRTRARSHPRSSGRPQSHRLLHRQDQVRQSRSSLLCRHHH